MVECYDLFDRAANTPDPAERLCITVIALSSAFHSVKIRKKKPFNPMLGETYELVTSKFRLLAEKVQHIPKQVVAF